MFFGPHLLEADDGRCRQTWRVADEGRQHFLEVAGRDSLQVEDGDQHLKALRSPRVSRQNRWRVSDALAFARCTVAHPRLANGDRADAGHDVALWKMAMTHHVLMARLGLEIRMLCEKLSNLRLDRLSQQRTRAAAQDLCQGVGEDPWLGELDDVIVGHGVSLLHWRSGGVEHHHDTPPYPVSPSPTSGHNSTATYPMRSPRRSRRPRSTAAGPRATEFLPSLSIVMAKSSLLCAATTLVRTQWRTRAARPIPRAVFAPQPRPTPSASPTTIRWSDNR